MKIFGKYALIAALIFIVAVSSTSCSTTPKQKFQVVSVDKINGSLDDGWKLTITIANNTAKDIVIKQGCAQIRHNGRNIGQLKMTNEVVIPRRRCSQVALPLKLSFSLGVVPILTKIYKGDYSGITVDYKVVLQGTFKEREFEQKNVPLEALAKQFNFGLKK